MAPRYLTRLTAAIWARRVPGGRTGGMRAFRPWRSPANRRPSGSSWWYA